MQRSQANPEHPSYLNALLSNRTGPLGQLLETVEDEQNNNDSELFLGAQEFWLASLLLSQPDPY